MRSASLRPTIAPSQLVGERPQTSFAFCGASLAARNGELVMKYFLLRKAARRRATGAGSKHVVLE